MKRIAWLFVLASLGCDSSKSAADGANATPPAKTSAKPDTRRRAETKNEPAAPEPEVKAPPKPDADPVPEPKVEISPTRALILSERGLERLAPSGETELVTPSTANECDTDDEHGVVWLVSQTEVSAYDPQDGKVHAVAKLPASSGPAASAFSWQVQRRSPGAPFPTVAAGNADGLDVCTALAVVVSKTPSVGGAAVAEGDREVYCFEDEGEDFDQRKLVPEEAAIKAGYDQARLTDAGFLVALHDRHAKDGPRKRASLKPPPAPVIKVDTTRCDASPEDCGAATYLGGQRLWSVVTDNSRGDFYHETSQLFDGKTASFWNPVTDARTPKPPAAPDESATLDVSPDGRWGVYGAKIVATADAKVTGTFAGALCGWQ